MPPEAAIKQVAFGLHLRGEVDYDAIDAVNQSSLKPLLKRSPLRYLHNRENPPEQTNGQFRGSAGHVAALEPERFVKEYALYEGAPVEPVEEGEEPAPRKKPIRRGKVWDAFVAANPGKKIIKADEFAQAMRIRDAVREDAVAGRYFKGKGVNECVLHWRDPHTGLTCKGRPDRIITLDGVDYIVDLKGTKNAMPFAFAAECARALYHMQAAFYCDGYEVLFKRAPRYVIAAVEIEEPNEVVVYPVGDDTLAVGRDEYRRGLEKLVECREKREWPGIANGLEIPLVLPKWARPNEDDDLADLGLEPF